MPPSTNGLLLINPRAGSSGGPAAEELAGEAERRGILACVLGKRDDAAALARDGAAAIIGAAGGDGSLASVAAVAVERQLPFVCVPFGTRKHFAYDLSLFTVGERSRLDEGRLHVYTAEGWLPRNWQERTGERFTIDWARTLEAAVDGEPARFEPPVELAIEPRALRVLLPRAPLG